MKSECGDVHRIHHNKFIALNFFRLNSVIVQRARGLELCEYSNLSNVEILRFGFTEQQSMLNQHLAQHRLSTLYQLKWGEWVE
jgi:hypothetical protein